MSEENKAVAPETQQTETQPETKPEAQVETPKQNTFTQEQLDNLIKSRLEAEQNFSLGRSTEITRDELKFSKFVQRLRKKFTELFNDLLRTQLVLKSIINDDDWIAIKEKIKYDFLQDGHFSELKNAELLRERIALANDVRDYVGKYFSVDYVRRNILKQSEREMADIDNQIKKEIDDGIIASPQTGSDPNEII